MQNNLRGFVELGKKAGYSFEIKDCETFMMTANRPCNHSEKLSEEELELVTGRSGDCFEPTGAGAGGDQVWYWDWYPEGGDDDTPYNGSD